MLLLFSWLFWRWVTSILNWGYTTWLDVMEFVVILNGGLIKLWSKWRVVSRAVSPWDQQMSDWSDWDILFELFKAQSGLCGEAGGSLSPLQWTSFRRSFLWCKGDLTSSANWHILIWCPFCEQRNQFSIQFRPIMNNMFSYPAFLKNTYNHLDPHQNIPSLLHICCTIENKCKKSKCGHLLKFSKCISRMGFNGLWLTFLQRFYPFSLHSVEWH